ncbi:hypothetical protein GCM10023191_016030 [Actinoallomurus oryzae]|uniref:Uncharacterized protein n=1 Tax=Actinoallomurus oryzae TaxID=502180 RepID=A0ABP8PK05_9ACTN
MTIIDRSYAEGRRRVLRAFDVSSHAGRTVTLWFSGTEDSSLQTGLVLDDVAVNAS